MRQFFDKYPKLRGQVDTRLTAFFQQDLIDLIGADELERVIEIVRYVPEVVKVDNIYLSDRSRKVEYHLRVLIKALLEELLRLRQRTGADLEIDGRIL